MRDPLPGVATYRVDFGTFPLRLPFDFRFTREEYESFRNLAADVRRSVQGDLRARLDSADFDLVVASNTAVSSDLADRVDTIERDFLRNHADFTSMRGYFEALSIQPYDSRLCREQVRIIGEAVLEEAVPTSLIGITRSRIEEAQAYANKKHQELQEQPNIPLRARAQFVQYRLGLLRHAQISILSLEEIYHGMLSDAYRKLRATEPQQRVTYADGMLRRYSDVVADLFRPTLRRCRIMQKPVEIPTLQIVPPETVIANPATPVPASAGTPQSELQLLLK